MNQDEWVRLGQEFERHLEDIVIRGKEADTLIVDGITYHLYTRPTVIDVHATLVEDKPQPGGDHESK